MNMRGPLSELSAEEISELTKHGNSLGKGLYGETMLVTYGGKSYVFKNFADNRRSITDVQYDKMLEQDVHLEIWNRLSKGCRKYICEPIRTNHPWISAQLSAAEGSRQDAKMDTFGKFHSSGKLEYKLSDKFKTIATTTPDMIKMQLAKALVCLHSKGAVHADLHANNVIVLYKLDDEDKKKINYLQLKLIDFGLSEVSDKTHSLMQYRQNGKLDIIRGADETNRQIAKLQRGMKRQMAFNQIYLYKLLGNTDTAYENAWKKIHNASARKIQRVRRSKLRPAPRFKLSNFLPAPNPFNNGRRDAGKKRKRGT
jgi:hypothetical protein